MFKTIKNVFIWLKEKTVKLWKVIVMIIVGGAVVVAGIQLISPPEPPLEPIEPPLVVETDTQALWHFEEISGDYLDETANNNDSDFIQVTSRTVTGKWGYSPEFDGVDDYIRVPDSVSLDLNQEGTIEGWVKIDDFIADRSFFTKAIGTEQRIQGEFMITPDPFLRFQIRDGTNHSTYDTNATFNAGEWYYVACVFDKSLTEYPKVYINGILDTGGDTLGTTMDNVGDITTDDPWYIGTWTGNDRFFYGFIDEMRISNVAHSAEKIKRAYYEHK